MNKYFRSTGEARMGSGELVGNISNGMQVSNMRLILKG